MSVSSWIRYSVEQELLKREGTGLAGEGGTNPRVVVERLRRDLDKLTAMLES